MYYNRRNNSDTGKKVAMMVGIIILYLIAQSWSISSSRRSRNMESIKAGYCYDVNTGIIYIESYVGLNSSDTSYTVYYDENGNMCRYDKISGKWISLNK